MMASTRALLIATMTAGVALAGCTVGPDSGPRGLLQEALAAADTLDTAHEALAHGYQPQGPCIPGMGVRWVHAADLDTELDVRHPEAALFLPTTSDIDDPRRQRFLGIAYVAITEGTANNTTATPPTLMSVPLNGPHPPDAAVDRWHAGLPVYLAEDHPSNTTFPRTMPGIECPRGTTGDEQDDSSSGDATRVPRPGGSVAPVTP